MRKTSENERKLINRLLDIDENEGFVLLAMCFLETSEMKDDALLYLEQNPKCSKKMFFKKAAEIKIERLKSNIKKYKIPPEETEVTKGNLEYYLKQLQAMMEEQQ